MSKIVEKYCELPKAIKRPLWQWWHKKMIKYDKDLKSTFMNYGYANLNGEPKLELKDQDEVERYSLQLYDHMARKTEIADKQVLEVGSGRGGGASYIARYFKPVSYTALDISKSVIDFCNSHHNVPNLNFIKGYAEKQPFEDESFDVVVNVESARCYRSLPDFFSEVHRVLRPEGQFLFADMIKRGEEEEINSDLQSSGFEIVTKTNITKNVVKSLDVDNERRVELIKGKVPGVLLSNFLQFAGTKDTERYNSFANESMGYWSYLLKKK